MARIPYATFETAEAAEVARLVKEQRGSVLDLYAMLLHSPPVALGWLTYLTAIRQKCALAGSLRELVIMRIAQLNGASYEAAQHRPFALREGVSEAQLADLQDWEQATSFTDEQRAVLAYTDAMTRQIKVPAPVFENIRQYFEPRLTVELTATIASYNMVSRFLEALEIHE